MKLSKNTICKCAALCVLSLAIASNAINLSGAIGVYDFTDEVSKEFYKLAMSGKISFDFFEKAGFAGGLCTGASFSTVPYNGGDHDFLMVPLILTGKYTYTPAQTSLQPFWAIGIGGYGKMDHNEWFTKNHYAATYGYSFTTGVSLPLKQRLLLVADIGVHILISPSYEDINTGGVQTTLGIAYKPGKMEHKKRTVPF
jgi:hypothetical protein